MKPGALQPDAVGHDLPCQQRQNFGGHHNRLPFHQRRSPHSMEVVQVRGSRAYAEPRIPSNLRVTLDHKRSTHQVADDTLNFASISIRIDDGSEYKSRCDKQ